MTKFKKRDHPRPEEDKGRRRDRISDRKERRPASDYVVKKVLAVQGGSSSDSNQSGHPKDVSMLILKDDDILFNTMFAVMEKFDDDEEAEEEVTL